MQRSPALLALTSARARALQLAAQGLITPPRARATKRSVASALRNMRVLQIDTIHVVARSPYLVLFSRLGAFRPRWLDELLEEGRVFECWAHEACFASVDDFGLLRRQALDRSRHWSARRARQMLEEHRPAMEELLLRVRERGPVRSADFDGDKPGKGGFWQWKREKQWLEAWFALGELMIARRDNFQRVYDLRERVIARALPEWTDAAMPTSDEAQQALVLAAVRALGVVEARHVDDYFRTSARTDERALDAWVLRGDLVRVRVAGWESCGYVHKDHLTLARRAARGDLTPTRTTLLSPFDPIVWDRSRAKAVFDFDYRLECYTPEDKRRWGYFVLPVLHRGELVGRVDAKAHRADGVFEVRAAYLEPRVRPTPGVVKGIAAALTECAAWHETPRVVVTKAEPRAFATSLEREIAPKT